MCGPNPDGTPLLPTWLHAFILTSQLNNMQTCSHSPLYIATKCWLGSPSFLLNPMVGSHDMLNPCTQPSGAQPLCSKNSSKVQTMVTNFNGCSQAIHQASTHIYLLSSPITLALPNYLTTITQHTIYMPSNYSNILFKCLKDAF